MIKYDWKFGERRREEEQIEQIEEDRSTELFQSIVQSILRERNEGRKKGRAKSVFPTTTRSNEYPQTLATSRVCTTGRAITRATITTCTHSRSCQISARVATRPITSLFERGGKGEFIIFTWDRHVIPWRRKIISDREMIDSNNRRNHVSCCSLFFLSPFLLKCSFLCSYVQIFHPCLTESLV